MGGMRVTVDSLVVFQPFHATAQKDVFVMSCHLARLANHFQSRARIMASVAAIARFGACAIGGAVVGGGAVHVVNATTPPSTTAAAWAAAATQASDAANEALTSAVWRRRTAEGALLYAETAHTYASALAERVARASAPAVLAVIEGDAPYAKAADDAATDAARRAVVADTERYVAAAAAAAERAAAAFEPKRRALHVALEAETAAGYSADAARDTARAFAKVAELLPPPQQPQPRTPKPIA